MATGKNMRSKQGSAVTVRSDEQGKSQRRNPYELFNELERWFSGPALGTWPRQFGGHWPAWPELRTPFGEHLPRVDVADSDKEVVVKAELPGVSKDDLEVSLTDTGIRISAKTRTEQEIKEDDYVRREISRGEYSRTIPLPSAVNGDKAQASFKDGVLTIRLQKQEVSKRRPIKVD